MEINNTELLFNLYGASKKLYSQKDNLATVTKFIQPLCTLYQADQWMLFFNDFTSEDIHTTSSYGILNCDKARLQEVLPLLFQNSESALLDKQQTEIIFSALDFGNIRTASSNSAIYSSFELNDNESMLLVFFRDLSSRPFTEQEFNQSIQINQFLTLFLKSSLFDSSSRDYVEELTAQIRRENTWTEALSWINQAKVDETHDHSSLDFYKGVLFQLSTLMHADSICMLEVDIKKKKVKNFSGNQESNQANNFSPIIKSLLINDELKKQHLWDKTNLEEGLLVSMDISHLVLIPLFIQSDLNSIICISKQQGCFDDSDKVIGRLFSDGVEKIIERRWFMSSLKRQNIDLQSRKKQLESLVKQLKNAQEQVLQNDKLASIGQLAAGVAHEINNPVGYVNSNLNSLSSYIKDIFVLIENYEQLESSVAQDNETLQKIKGLKDELDLDFIREDLNELLNESHEGISRVKKIVEDLKHFSHVDEAVWQRTDIHTGIDSTLNIVANELKYKANIVKDYGALPEIACMPSKLNQVFMNLLVNAGHAIEKDGKVTISSRQIDDNFICIKISDTGKGIEKTHLNRIFDPFFTTKPIGSGTGLGLSLSHGIIEKHSGELSVESKVGVGTAFTIKLPINQKESEETCS